MRIAKLEKIAGNDNSYTKTYDFLKKVCEESKVVSSASLKGSRSRIVNFGYGEHSFLSFFINKGTTSSVKINYHYFYENINLSEHLKDDSIESVYTEFINYFISEIMTVELDGKKIDIRLYF